MEFAPEQEDRALPAAANAPTAAVIIIGDEILSGRTRDANLPWLAERLGALGIPVAEARVVSDRTEAIVQAVNALRFMVGNDQALLEEGISPDTARELQLRGHKLGLMAGRSRIEANVLAGEIKTEITRPMAVFSIASLLRSGETSAYRKPRPRRTAGTRPTAM